MSSGQPHHAMHKTNTKKKLRRIPPPSGELYKLYVTNNLTIKAIVKHYLVTQPERYPTLGFGTVQRWLNRYKIPLREVTTSVPPIY